MYKILALLGMLTLFSCGPVPQNGRDGRDGEGCKTVEVGGKKMLDCNGTITEIAEGEDGKNGKDGKDGTVGPVGPEGPLGPEGPAGENGATYTRYFKCEGKMDTGEGRYHEFRAVFAEYEKGGGDFRAEVSFEDVYEKSIGGGYFLPGEDPQAADGVFRATFKSGSLEIYRLSTGDRETFKCEEKEL